jgi:aminomethyltransferase
LYDLHVALGARMVDFGGWDMPVHYGSQIEEHHAVRRSAGVFDVSHMCVIDVRGARTAVVNAGTRNSDLAWIRAHASGFDIEVRERAELAMLAIQGPDARARLAALLTPPDAQTALALPTFFGVQLGAWFVARTGYTGEDGFEVTLPADGAVDLWNRLNDLGVQSCGLGARDTLRLEAGLNLYGNDMDATTHPLESGLEWTVAFEPSSRAFMGRAPLERARDAGGGRKLVGLLLGSAP